MTDSVRPHRQQPTRLPGPWASLGKNTGVGCHFLLQYMKLKSEREVAQSCPTLSDPMDCSPPSSSVHGIFQARVLEWVAIVGKKSTCQCRRCKSGGFDPWVGKIPWRRSWHPLQYPCLENPMDRGVWQATVHKVTKRQT